MTTNTTTISCIRPDQVPSYRRRRCEAGGPAAVRRASRAKLQTSHRSDQARVLEEGGSPQLRRLNVQTMTSSFMLRLNRCQVLSEFIRSVWLLKYKPIVTSKEHLNTKMFILSKTKRIHTHYY